MQSFYYKLANRTFGNVMIASFHNFLGKLRTFDGVAHKQNLESFLNQNNLIINLPESFFGIANVVLKVGNNSFSKLISVIK